MARSPAVSPFTVEAVSVTLLLPVNGYLAEYVSALDVAHTRAISTGDSAGAQALAMLGILCDRGHTALIEDRLAAPARADRPSAIVANTMQDARRS